ITMDASFRALEAFISPSALIRDNSVVSDFLTSPCAPRQYKYFLSVCKGGLDAAVSTEKLLVRQFNAHQHREVQTPLQSSAARAQYFFNNRINSN
uniref:Uncharacterized protein n=1 Tax=Amazona collaria TaxID=241587 RepID=A0A8B9F952_9PSIT